MAPSKNLEILISTLFALRGVLGAVGADSTSFATATLNLGGNPFDFSISSTTSTRGVVDETSSASAANAQDGGGGGLTTASPGDLATVTIIDMPAYSIAVGCIRECLMQEFEAGVPDGLVLAAELGCTSPYYNGCYCTQAVSSSASSLISQCIVHFCTGTAEIPDALSIYDNYCATAGYPAENLATTTTVNAGNPQTTVVTGNPQTTVVTGAVVYTVTNGGSTFPITETSVQTVVTIPTSLSNSGGGGGSKVNVGGIVGGVLGALLLIAILLGIFLVWLPRRQKKAAAAAQSQTFVQTQPQTKGEEGSTFVPTAAVVRKGGGRAELPEKGGVGGVAVGEKEVIPDVKEEVVVVNRGVEVDGTGMGGGGEGRYGLRPEELDSEGRYVGELHGDGRQFGGVELEGREVR